MAAPLRVGIVADDLTSAADGGGPFVEAGLTCTVGCAGRVPKTGEVRAVDTRSRSLDESEAASATRRAVGQLDAAEVLLKTVDSTLRGHVRAEIAAAEAATRRLRVCLAPAFPGAGRTTREGIQEVHGRALLETSYAADAVHPARSERLAELVEGLGRARLVHARDGWPEVGGERVLLVDVEQQEELDAFVAEARDADDWLWVGSPGLALAWGRRLAQVSPRAPSPGARPARRVLTAVGSLNRVSRRQLAVVTSASEGREDLTVLATPDEVQGDPAQAIEALARDVAALADPPGFDGLVATGGATMEALLEALGVDAFDLAGELEPGFPHGVTPSGLRLALKAGGFGDEDALLRAALMLRGDSV